MFDFVNALGLTFGLSVLWRYAPAAREAIQKLMVRRYVLGRGHMLILGIEATWTAMVSRTIILWAWRWYGEPIGGLDGIDTAFAAWLIITGGACHLAASSMPDEAVQRPRLSGRLIVNAIGLGLFLGAVIAMRRYANSP